VTSRSERLKMQRRMQRRIRLVVEERRMAFGVRPKSAEVATDPETTVEIPPITAIKAIGRVAVRPAR